MLDVVVMSKYGKFPRPLLSAMVLQIIDIDTDGKDKIVFSKKFTELEEVNTELSVYGVSTEFKVPDHVSGEAEMSVFLGLVFYLSQSLKMNLHSLKCLF